MKSIYLFLIFLGISCSYSSDDPPQISSEIIGKWIWVQSSGGIAGVIETPESTGNQIRIEFSTNTYKMYLNGVLDAEMFYKIERGSSILMTGDTDLIIYENESKQSIELNGKELILYDECIDCFKHEYSKE